MRRLADISVVSLIFNNQFNPLPIISNKSEDDGKKESDVFLLQSYSGLT